MASALIRLCLTIIIISGFGLSSTVYAQRSGSTSRNTGTSAEAGSSGSIEGRVVLPTGQPVPGRVKITLSTINDPGLILYTDANGNFLFQNLRSATYYVEVSGDPKLYEPVVEQVRLLRGMRYTGLLIHLREKSEATKRSTGGTVSVAETDALIPAQARKEFDKATKLVTERKIDEAIESYKKAIALYPRYLMAHNDLGVHYLNLNQLSEAQEHFETAIDINPKAFNPNLNLGICLIRQKRLGDALERLNNALAIDSSSAAAHLYVGAVLGEMDELEKAERELNTALSLASAQMSVARYYLAHIYMKKGNREAAIRELNSYLEAEPNGEYTARARTLLEQLK